MQSLSDTTMQDFSLQTQSNMAQPSQVIRLDAGNGAAYAALTYPHFRPLLHRLTIGTEIIAVGAELDSIPVGLAIARLNPTPHHPLEGQVLSLFVLPPYRNQGWGGALLTQLEVELQRSGCQQLKIHYLSSAVSPSLERILAQQQWFAPQATSLVGYASTDRVEQATHPHLLDDLERLLARLPQNYMVFPWQTLTPAERFDLMQQMATDTLMQQFNPFLEEDKREPLNSLGLRYGDRIVGWIITHRIAPDLIRYTQMYVDPNSQPLSRSILLLARAIQLQVEHLPQTKGTFRVDIDNTSMVNFIHRRLKPYLEETQTAYRATKFLQ